MKTLLNRRGEAEPSSVKRGSGRGRGLGRESAVQLREAPGAVKKHLPIVAADRDGNPQYAFEEKGVVLAPEELPQLSLLRFIDELPRLQSIARGERPTPVTLEIDPTNVCNHHCEWCIEAEYIENDKNTLRRDTLLRVIEEAASMGIRSVVFKGGGEPLLHPAIGEALALAHKLGMRSGIITNGEHIAKWREEILEFATWVRVSLDAGSEEDHQRVHRPRAGAFARCLEGVSMLTGNVFCGIQFVLNERNWQGAVSGTQAAKEAGARYIQFKPVVREQTLDTDATVAIDAIVNQARREFDGKDGFRVLGTGTAKRLPPYRNCQGHQLVMIVGANGEAYACCSTRGKADYSFGSVHQQSLDSIWDGTQREKVLDRIDGYACRPGCRARSGFRYDTYNQVIDYLAGDRPHSDFF